MTGRASAETSREQRARLHLTPGAQISAGLAVVAAATLASAAFDGKLLPARHAGQMIAADVATAALCLAVRAIWRRSASARPWPDLVGLLVGSALVADIVARIGVSHDLEYTAELLLVVVYASSVFESWRWLLGFAIGTAVAWWPFAAGAEAPRSLPAAAGSLALASIAALAFQRVRTRTRAWLALLRTRDRLRVDRLRKALTVARTELEERRRTEVEGNRLRDQLVQAQKMDAVARLAGGVAHGMNNVLTSISVTGELLLEDERLDEVGREDLRSILAAARRGATLSRNLLAFSRRGKYASDLLDVSAVVDSARLLLSRTLPPEIDLEVDIGDPEARVEGDANQLVQAIVNLCVNAADAMPDGGVVRVRTSRVTLDGSEAHRRAVAPGDYVAVQVRDSGAGMDSETRRLAFEPFFTTKPLGAGSGLGLAMVYGTARNHGGHAEVENAAGGGTIVTLHLPRVAEVKANDSSAPPSGPRADVTDRSVLLVDDEPAVRAVARRILARQGLRVHDAENGRRALSVWTADGPFDLVVVDMAMPVMGGKEFFARLRRLDPAARVLLVSGFAPDSDAQEMLAAGALGFVEKPYTSTSLARAVRAALDRDPPTGREVDFSVS